MLRGLKHEERRIKFKKYNQSEKGKERTRNYQQSEKGKEASRNYEKKNQESRNKHKRQKVTCECGATVALTNMARHRRTAKHREWGREQEAPG